MSEKNQRQRKIPCVYMRGGTSKGIVFHEKDLPEDKAEWPEIFMKVMGTPDVKQIDGMGGTVSSTSKIAVIKKSERPGTDIDYTFCQVSVADAAVDMSVNCGNLSSLVGPFAIDEGLVEAKEPVTVVKIYNTNTGKAIEEHVRVQDGQACVYGEEEIAGVPGTGSKIDVYFEDPAGSITGKLFPTGQKKETFEVPGYGKTEVTVIDCGTPIVFVKASDLGLKGAELTELNQNKTLMAQIECIRGLAAQKLGFVEKWEEARLKSAAAPDVVLVSPAQNYVTLDGKEIEKEQMDLCVRAVSMGAIHKAYPVTGAIGTSAAMKLNGTIVNELAKKTDGTVVRMGHSSGIMTADIRLDGEKVQRVGVVRTARRIMDGYVYIR